LFEATASLKGHTGSVVSLVFGAGRLYSGSMDNTIRVWDLENMQCIHTLNKHSEIVMSLVCWDQYLLSCSLDQTLKVPPFPLFAIFVSLASNLTCIFLTIIFLSMQIWAATEAGDLEVAYTHNEEHVCQYVRLASFCRY